MTSTKEKEKEEKEKEEKEAKKRKRLADDFYNLLGTIQEITESSKWEDCKQIFEERREKLPSDKENFLKEVFDKHITELKEKEKEEKKRRDDRVSVSVSASDSQCIEVVLRCLATYGDGLGPHELNDGGVLATVIAAGFKGEFEYETCHSGYAEVVKQKQVPSTCAALGFFQPNRYLGLLYKLPRLFFFSTAQLRHVMVEMFFCISEFDNPPLLGGIL